MNTPSYSKSPIANTDVASASDVRVRAGAWQWVAIARAHRQRVEVVIYCEKCENVCIGD